MKCYKKGLPEFQVALFGFYYKKSEK